MGGGGSKLCISNLHPDFKNGESELKISIVFSSQRKQRQVSQRNNSTASSGSLVFLSRPNRKEGRNMDALSKSHVVLSWIENRHLREELGSKSALSGPPPGPPPP